MKRMLTMTVAAAALMLGVAGASAQDMQMYVTGEGENRMVMGGENSAGAPIMMGENGAAPANCPEGSYYEGADEQIFACGDDSMGYSMAAPGEGMMMSNGEAYPDGAMMMNPAGGQDGDTSPGGGTSSPGSTAN